MTNKERLDKIIDLVFNYENRCHCLVSSKDVNDILDCKKTILQDLDRLEKLEKVIEIFKKEGLIIKIDESDKDLSYLVMAFKLEDKIFILYETFDKNKINSLKEVFEDE